MYNLYSSHGRFSIKIMTTQCREKKYGVYSEVEVEHRAVFMTSEPSRLQPHRTPLAWFRPRSHISFRSWRAKPRARPWFRSPQQFEGRRLCLSQSIWASQRTPRWSHQLPDEPSCMDRTSSHRTLQGQVFRCSELLSSTSLG